MGIIIWLIVGGIVGWLASLIMRTDAQQGILLNIVVGIVGAFLGGTAGAMISGAIAHIAAGKSVGDTDLGTALAAIPGAVIAMAIVYAIGLRNERELAQ